MNRRELIRSMALASFAIGSTSLLSPTRALAATCPTYPTLDRTLVNVMLSGGADLRFLFMPFYGLDGRLGAGHMDLMWSARQNMYALARDGSYTNYQEMFDNEYLFVPSDGLRPAFGIYRRCGWLHQQFMNGNVAIVANAHCSKNRRHDQSILNADVGEPGYTQLNSDRDGWGGRLVEYIGGGANAVEIGGSISTFNKGSAEGGRLAQVVHASNTRNISLPNASDGNSTGHGSVVTRALKSYYAGRGPEVATEKAADWPYQAFFNHNESFRQLEALMSARLDACGGIPDSLNFAGANSLGSNSWEQQIRNLHDACMAADIFGARTLSMSYGGWDTHGSEETRIGRNLEDIFGAEKGLDKGMQEISTFDSNASEQLTFYFASDFGRQIVTNGDNGTDHGTGTYSILAGNDVNGGVYGDMFPVSETLPESSGAIPLERHGADITGLTSTEHILGQVAEWMKPGASSAVVPDLAYAPIEPTVTLELLPGAG
jgi:uncharacterized protein (DUF1501 family)